MILELWLNTPMIRIFAFLINSLWYDWRYALYLQFLLIVFDMITNMISNKIVTELFITGTKLNNSLVFITQSYFAVPIDINSINSTHFFIMKIPNKQELIVDQILILKTLKRYFKNAQQNYFLCQLTIQF